MIIRNAQPSDAAAIATVHVTSWRESYAGLIPRVVLNSLSVDQRTANWEQQITQAAEGTRKESVIVAVDPEAGVVGFAAAGPERNKQAAYDGELYAIYLLRRFQGVGIGRQLFHEAAHCLDEHGYKNMRLWVLDGNNTKHFYAHLGGVKVGEKSEEIGGKAFTLIAYGWPTLPTRSKSQ